MKVLVFCIVILVVGLKYTAGIFKYENKAVYLTHYLFDKKFAMISYLLLNFQYRFNISASCSCNAGSGTSCSADVDDLCEYFLTLYCKINGVAEGAAVSQANGCSNCGSLYKICATTCNYCDT